jgi:choice-of-anchor B domain-containing protein
MRYFLIIFILGYCWVYVSGQTFNVAPQGHVSGMPGNEYNDVWGYVDPLGKEHAIIGSSKAINIFDVSDCANPILKFQYVDGGNAIWRDFKTYMGFAYGVCDHGTNRPCREGLEIINLANYAVTQDSSKFKSAHNIWVDEAYGRLYVAGSNHSSTTDELLIYTLDTEVVNGITYHGTPGNPVYVTKQVTSYIHDMYVKNNIVYASHGNNGYHMWNTTNLASIVELASNLDGAGYNHSSYVTADGYSYCCEETPRGRPIKIYEISGSGTSTSINLLPSFTDPCESPTYTNPRPHNPFVKGDTLFIAYYEDGVVMWDITNRANPKRIAYYDTYTGQNGLGYNQAAHDWHGAWGVYPYLPSGCHIVGDITGGLFTFKMDIPVSDGTNLGKIAKVNNTNLVFSSEGKGVVLRNDEGYCYRLKVSPTGALSTQQIICHTNTGLNTKVYKQDIAFDTADRGVVLKGSATTCYLVKINNSGVLSTSAVSCAASTGSNTIVSDSDVFVETNTKGIILRGSTNCYRVTVGPTGNLVSTQLNACP